MISRKTKIFSISLLAWGLTGGLFSQSVAVAQQATPFSLKDCIQFTLQHHPNSSMGQNNVLLADQKIREAQAAYLPSVSGSVGLDYNLKLQTSIIPAGTFGPSETRLQMGNKFSTSASVQADQTIFDKSALLNIAATKVDREVSDLNVLKQNETLAYNTATAYYQAMSYTEKRRLLRENEKRYQQLLGILKLRYEQGVIKKTEYDRTRVSLNNIQAELAQNENQYQLALNTLRNAMGMTENLLFTLADSLDYQMVVEKPALVPFRPDSLSAAQIDAKNLELRQLEIERKQAAYLPTVSAYAKYGANAYGSDFGNAYTRWFDYSAVGIRVSVPIFSGFRRSSQLQQSLLNAENQRQTQALNAAAYQMDHDNATLRWLNAYTSLQKNTENLQLAQEVLDATAVEYEAGKTMMSSFLDADYAFKEAQTNYLTALLDFLTSQLAYEKASGTLTSYLNALK